MAGPSSIKLLQIFICLAELLAWRKIHVGLTLCESFPSLGCSKLSDGEAMRLFFFA